MKLFTRRWRSMDQLPEAFPTVSLLVSTVLGEPVRFARPLFVDLEKRLARLPGMVTSLPFEAVQWHPIYSQKWLDTPVTREWCGEVGMSCVQSPNRDSYGAAPVIVSFAAGDGGGADWCELEIGLMRIHKPTRGDVLAALDLTEGKR